jgi:prepilin-type N-terminal cleavage/methylation domain-containing protein
MLTRREKRGVGRRTRRGFTLVEAVLSLAILGIIMASIGAASTVFVRLLPREKDPRVSALQMAAGLERLESDVNGMVAIHTMNASTLEFYVNGLAANGATALVSYAYDSKSNTLSRTVANQDAELVLSSARNFKFSYTLGSRPHPELTEPEAVASNLGTNVLSAIDQTHTIDATKAIRQEIRPTLAENASGWKVDAVKLRLKRHTHLGGGSCRIMLFRINDDETLATSPMALLDVPLTSLTHSTLPASEETYTFSNTPWLDPTDRVALVIMPIGSAIRAVLSRNNGYPSLRMHEFSDNTSVPLDTYQVYHRAVGKVMQPGDTPVSVQVLEGVSAEFLHSILGTELRQTTRLLAPVLVEP